MMKRYGSIMATLAVGMLAGGVFGTGCGTGGGETCLTNADCTVPGETCIANAGTIGTSTCGCDPTAATDSCTEADATTICHPDRGACEQACETNDDCTAAGETCDVATKACRAPSDLGCTTSTDCDQATEVCDTEAKACVAFCTATSCTTGEVCNDGTKLCEPDCKLAGNECAVGSTCDAASGICLQGCGGETCEATEVCDPVLNACVDRCSANADCDILSNEVCDTTSGLCLLSCQDIDAEPCTGDDICLSTGLCGAAECTGSVECDGDFCNQGACESRLTIHECSTTVREYVDFDTNVCKPTTGNLNACAAAGGRDTDKAEKATGPTFYDGVSVSRKESSDNCQGGPEVTFFARYYDAQGDMATASQGTKALNGDILQVVASSDKFTSDFPKICGTDTSDGLCAGETSNATSGSFLFTLCRPIGSGDEDVAVILSDKSDNFGNTLCIEIKPIHLDP